MGHVLNHPLSRLSIVVLLVTMVLGQASYAAEAPGQKTSPIVRAIAVKGNERVGNDVVFDAVKETVVGEAFDPEKVKADLQNIAAKGNFYDVEASIEPFEDGARVIFKPVELAVSKFEITADQVPGDKLKKYFSLKEGDLIGPQSIKEFQKEMRLLPEKTPDDLDYIMQVDSYHITPDGVVKLDVKAARVGAVAVTGNEKTRDYVIQREITLKPGDVLSVEAVRQSLRRIYQLKFFDDVKPRFMAMNSDDPHSLQVVFEVTERKTGSASFGAGYSSADGLLGFIDVSEDNFLGRGQRVSVRWEVAKSKNEYDLGFYEPYLDGSGTSFGFNLYRRSANRSQINGSNELFYTEKRLGGDVSLGRRLSDFTRASLSYRLENSEILPQPGKLGPAADRSSTRSLTLGLKTDTSDRPFNPTDGIRYDLSAEKAGGFLGGDTEFAKYGATLSKYMQVGSNGQVLAMRVSTGLADRQLPLLEEYKLGGSETIRGYRYGELQGDKMIFGNAEYRFRIADKVQGVVFADAGNAFDFNQPLDLGSLKKAFGVGVRLDTPLGVMRIDYGIGEKGGNAYFSLGPSF